MRLSDVKGERAIDVIADLIDPIANIASDKTTTELFARKKLPEGMEPKSFLLARIKKSVPALLKSHKKDVVAILAAIEGVSTKKYVETLDLLKITKDCTELLTDDAFMALFTSAQSEVSCGSAQESTLGQKV